MNLIWIAFLTGLTTGGISCLAVQGGLVTAVAKNKTDVLVFLVAKLFSHILLGAALGIVGSTLTLAPSIMGIVQIAVGLFMLATAARLLNIHPIFRYFVLTPPRFAYRLMRRQTAPALLGLSTVLMPCGVTQATMAVAVATGNPVLGAAIMGAFVLGTSPLFFVLGASLTELLKRPAFAYAAAAVVVVFGIMSINGGLGLRGSFYTLQNLYAAIITPTDDLARGTTSAAVENGVQTVEIDVREYGYKSTVHTLKKGVPVKLKLITNNTRGCARAFTIPELNISKVLPETGVETIEFTPKKEGRLAYACSMGMYTGSFSVIP